MEEITINKSLYELFKIIGKIIQFVNISKLFRYQN